MGTPAHFYKRLIIDSITSGNRLEAEYSRGCHCACCGWKLERDVYL